MLSRLIEGINELPEDIELELIGGGIAYAHRGSALVAGQPRHLPFEQLTVSSTIVSSR